MGIILSASGGNFLQLLFNILNNIVLHCKRKKCTVKQAKKEPLNTNNELASAAVPEGKP